MKSGMKKHKIAIAGATGNVGREILNVMSERGFDECEVFALASPKSIGKSVSFGKKVLTVEDVSIFDFKKVNFVFFASGSAFSREYRERVINAGCIIIDNSAAFRMEDGVPLIVADVNSEDVKHYKNKKILTNPNCTASPIAMTLKPLEHYGIKRIVASTYQSVSGAGKEAMDELYNRTKAFYEIKISGKEVTDREDKDIFTKDIAFNCIPHIDVFLEDGRTKEEWKMEVELQKIMKNQNIKVSATCVRVPVFVGHSISINVEFENPFELDDVIERLSNFEGLVVLDRRENGGYITPREVVRTTGVYVSRIRRDETLQSGLSMWISSDNVYGIGAAYNAVRMLEELLKYS
jgi:aspartate-semialdehyde dehydrogenase